MEHTLNDNDKWLYLSQVHLTGYKTVIDTKIKLSKGLNIIIGKNGVGKTNFLTVLAKSLYMDFDNIGIDFSSELWFKNGKEVILTHRILQNEKVKTDVIATKEIKTSLKINDEEIKIPQDLPTYLSQNNLDVQPSMITHGIPLQNFLFIQTPYTFSINNGTPDINWASEISTMPYFIKCLMAALVFDLYGATRISINDTAESIKSRIIKSLIDIDALKAPLKEYSPIEDLRFNDGINVFIDKEKNSVTVSNLFLEYKIGSSWHPFSNLSDGTKRMFYIISELSIPARYYVTSNLLSKRIIPIKRIILIEEPELGVHPHQLFKIMEFIKNYSITHQIILTTHSPQVLDDAIGEKELENIIIAYEDNSKGTLLRHLSNQEIEKAKDYMKDSYLSDYWAHSDLEFKHH